MKILRLPEASARVGLGRSGIYQRIAAGDFPRPIKLGVRAVGFVEEEIEAWIEARPRSGGSGTPPIAKEG